MRNSIKILPFVLLIAAQSAYDNFAPLQNTNWSIFYFASRNLATAWLAYLVATGSIWKRLPFYVIGLGYVYQLVRNLLKINMDYNDYMLSVNDYEANLLLTLLIIIGFSIVLGKLYNLFGWVSRKFKKRGN